jgi:hypothetical protein
MKCVSSLSCSWKFTTRSYPEPTQSGPHFHILFSYDLFSYYPPIYTSVSQIHIFRL